MNAISLSLPFLLLPHLTILLYKFNAFSMLTKHFSCTVAIAFAIWGTTAKLANFFFLFYDFMDRKCINTIDVSNLSIHFFFFYYVGHISPFHFKEAHCGYTFTYSNCQHHYSGSLEPLLSQIRVAWTQHCDTDHSLSDNMVTSRWLRGWI